MDRRRKNGNKAMKICLILASFLITLATWGQNQLQIPLEWEEVNGQQLQLLNESYDAQYTPVVFRRFPIASSDTLIAKISSESSKNFTQYSPPEHLATTYLLRTFTEWEGSQKYAKIFLYPMKNNGQRGISVLTNVVIDLIHQPAKPKIQFRRGPFANQSILADGQILKIGITETGVHHLNYNDLPDSWKNGPIDINRLELFTGHGTVLPKRVGDARIDDLVEIPYYLPQGSFSENQSLLFYGQGKDIPIVNNTSESIEIAHNFYADTNYYFLRYGIDKGIQLSESPIISQIKSELSSQGKDAIRYEDEKFNILLDLISVQGSGRIWYTEKYIGNTQKDFSYLLQRPPIVWEEPLHFNAEIAGRSSTNSIAEFTFGNQKIQKNIFSVNTVDAYTLSARTANFSEQYTINNPTLIYRFSSSDGSALHWLDYIQLGFTKELSLIDQDQLYFTSFKKNIDFKIPGPSNINWQAWNITEPYAYFPTGLNKTDNYVYIEGSSADYQSYVIFNPTATLSVQSIQEIENQNIHSLQSVDYLIIYHSSFETSVKRLVNFRSEKNKFNIAAIPVHQIYNEYSSGKLDPTALRDCIKMLYERNNTSLRILLFGDGSFDYKLRNPSLGYGNENFVPVFESENSWDPIRAFPSDDYYALLNDNEGEDLRGALDVPIGRIPVRTTAEANNIVQKIIDYESKPETLGPWKSQTLFVSDDGNYNLFLGYTERLTEEMEEKEARFDINKAYVDAHPKEVRSNEIRSPKTNERINNSAFEGQLIINYQGHGGSKGWSDESILSKVDLEKWNNYLKYPLLVTATCTFAGYDDPREVTAGEFALSLPDKGAIALFTTTRVVYASSNDRLSNSVFNRLYENIDGNLELGEWLRLAKNANRSDTLEINARKFTLLGDPALTLGIPKHKVEITAINNVSILSLDSVQLSALDKVRIQGRVINGAGQVQSHINGILSPILYDKKKTRTTLGQGTENYSVPFSEWQNTLYKGRTSITNGLFDFEFIIPKDIDYQLGQGRLSLYAAASGSSLEDGWGIVESIYIGGSSQNAIPNDHQGPEIEVFLEDRQFQNGDEVSDHPLLLIDISDPSGINVSGNGIGHDLTYILDEETTNPVVLNNYFEYDLNSYSTGKVEYPLENLAPGKHTLTIKGWDSHNNSSEKTIEFFVNKQGLEITHLYNYPNPFFNKTEFQFENPLIGSDLDIIIDIYTVSGKLAHRIIDQRNSASQLIRNIFWDGNNRYGNKLANGVYLYKLKILEKNGSKPTQITSNFQKLLILN